MEKKFHLFVRRHTGTGTTVSVVGQPHLTAFGETVGQARSDLASTLGRLLEQDHDDLAQATTHWQRMELRRVDVTLRAKQHRRLLPVPMRFSVLVHPTGPVRERPGKGTPITGPIEIFLPRIGLRQSIDEARDLEVWVEELVRKEFFMAPLERLRSAAYEGTESLEAMVVTYRPAKGARSSTPDDEPGRRDAIDDRRRRFPPLPEGLEEACRALHHEAALGALERAFQRERELARLTELITGPRRAGVLLLGPSGAGKTALVHELAARALEPEGPLAGLEIYSTSGARIIAGMRYLGEWQARLERMLRALRMRRSLLHLGSLSEFLSTFPAGSGLDAAGYLGPAIAAGDAAVIIEATHEDAARAERTHASFLQTLRPMALPPLDRAGAWLALTAASNRIGRDLRVRFDEPALRAALDLSERFYPRTPPPGMAVSLLRAAAQQSDSPGAGAHAPPAPPEASATKPMTGVSAEALVAAFSRRTGLPQSLVDPQTPLDPDEVLATLQRRVVGQDAAIALLRDLVVTLKTALGDPRKPLGSFLLLGPTGVGKTESALALTEFLFGDEKRLVRLDLSEFAAPGSAARLIGLYGAEGVLTRRVREQPFGVVLLDEIEKADLGVHDLLLQLLGDGRLTDATGSAVDFTNTVIVMTSNLGADTAGRAVGFGEATATSLEAHYRAAAARFFRPEWLNRVDHLVPYRALDRDSIRTIARRALDAALGREGIARRGVTVHYDPAVVDLLADLGLDPRYGARPLKRTIEQRVVAPLAWLLAERGARPPRPACGSSPSAAPSSCASRVSKHDAAPSLEGE
ncbi:MAG: AAA family ATPase [Polyangiaceae bacterium]|nr:AAA family ATPase [Polyangiaceae bacterium]